MFNIFEKIGRRKFFRSSVKIAGLAVLAMSRANPLYSLAPRNFARGLKGNRGSLMIPSLWWRKLSKTEDGELSYWDTPKLRSLKVNWVSVSYRPLDEHNKYVGTSWVIPPGLIERVMALAKPGLAHAHNAGIQVVGTTDSMQFNPEVMRDAGIDPVPLYGRSIAGAVIGFDTYQKGNHMSCLMNPHWQDIEVAIGKAHAEAGFDGLFLDLFPYAVREGMLCACEHCKKEWKTYSIKTFGKQQDYPRGPLHLRDEVDRVFFAWRIEAIHHFMKKIQEVAEKINPGFKVILNCNADNPCMAYLLLLGMPQPTSELGQLNAGNESSLYLYRMIESASRDQLFAQFNGSKQYLPDYKYKTALAEAYAAGGALMLAAKNDQMDHINEQFSDFLMKNRSAFEGSVSDAHVAILFSWRDHTFLQRRDAAVRTDRMQWPINSARRTAAVLSSKGIPYDYIFVEQGLTATALLRYKIVIAPELKLLDDQDAQVIQKFVNDGGKLLTLGSFGTMRSDGTRYIKSDTGRVKSWTSREAENGYLEASYGKGAICIAESYMTGNSEADMATTTTFDKAADFIGLDSQLKVTNNGNGRLASTIRKNGRYRFIHLIRYACSGETKESPVDLLYRIPTRSKIKAVTGVSPYTGNNREVLRWKTEGDHLTITTRLELYTMIRVELSDR